MKARYMLSEVSKMLNVRAHRIVYAVTQGFVPEPKVRFNRVRVFSEQDVQRLREHFNGRGQEQHQEKDINQA